MFLPTNGFVFRTKPLKVELLAGEQKATEMGDQCLLAFAGVSWVVQDFVHPQYEASKPFSFSHALQVRGWRTTVVTDRHALAAHEFWQLGCNNLAMLAKKKQFFHINNMRFAQNNGSDM